MTDAPAGQGHALGDRLSHHSGSPSRRRLRRSELAVPGSRQDMIEKAVGTDADVVFIDLEDAVDPSEKENARRNTVQALNDLDWGSTARACRINGLRSPWFYDDVTTLLSEAGGSIDLLIIPKVEEPRQIWFVDDLLSLLEQSNGLQVGHVGLEILVEESSALAHVESIAASSSRIEALTLGTGDLGASQGVRRSKMEVLNWGPLELWQYAMNRCVVAGRAHGVDSVDTPQGDFGDSEGFLKAAAAAALMGFAGKWCIHPSQVPMANEVFAPSRDEIALAWEVVSALDSDGTGGGGAAKIGSVMIDEATARLHRSILERAKQCGIDIEAKGPGV